MSFTEIQSQNLKDEIYTSSPHISAEKRLKQSSSAKSHTTSITYPKQSSLQHDFPYSFYCGDNENSKKMIFLKNPIKGKQLEKNLKNEKDFNQVHDILTDVSAVFEFDRVFGQNINNNKVYNHVCKRLVVDSINGKNSTIIAMGPENSGKTYLLRGEETRDKGIIVSFLEDLADMGEISKQSASIHIAIKCSIFGVYQNQLIDFLSHRLNDKIYVYIISFSQWFKINEGIETTEGEEPFYGLQSATNFVEERVQGTGDFKHIYRKSMNNMKLIINQYKDNDFKRDCHMVYRIIIERSIADQRPHRSFVNFVSLAATDNLIDRKIVREDLKTLLRHLLYCATAFTQIINFCGFFSNEDEAAAFVHQRSKLTQILYPSMNEASNIAVIACVSPAQRSVEGSIYAVEFCYAIHQEVIGGFRRPRRTASSKSRVALSKTTIETSDIEKPSKSLQKNTSMNESMQHRSRSFSYEGAGDFNSLYDLYNKTKKHLQSHESIIKDEKSFSRKYGTDGSDEDEEFALIEHDIQNLKKEIYTKIEEAIGQSIEQGLQTTEGNTERLAEESLRASRSLHHIKKHIEEKEKLQNEAIQVLKKKEEKVTTKLKSQKHKINELEALLKEKDVLISKYKESLTESRKDLLKTGDRLINLKAKDEKVLFEEEENQGAIVKLKNKLEKKRNKIISSTLGDEILKLNEKINHLQNENLRLQTEINNYQGEGTQQEESLKALQGEINNLKGEIEKQHKVNSVLRDNNDTQDKMIDNLKKKLKELITQNEKALVEKEHVVNMLSKEKEKLESEKIKKYQHQIQKLEEAKKGLEQENQIVRKEREQMKKAQDAEIQRLYSLLQEIRTELESTRNHQEELQLRSGSEMTRREREILELQTEIKKLYLELNDERIRSREMREENAKLIDQNKQKLKLLDKYEKQLQDLSNEQNTQMSNLETKIEEFAREITEVKVENTELRETENALLKRLDQSEASRQELSQRYTELRKENRALKDNIKEIDEKMRRLINQNTIEVRQLHQHGRKDLGRFFEDDDQQTFETILSNMTRQFLF